MSEKIEPALTADETTELREIVSGLYLVGIAVQQVGGDEMLVEWNLINGWQLSGLAWML